MIKTEIPSFDPPEMVPSAYTTIQTIDSKGNMGNTSKIMLIDISVKMGIVENIHIGANCNPDEIACFTSLFKEFRDVFPSSYDEIPGIDPSIFKHEIKIYDNTKPIQQRFKTIHPCKAAAIKIEVEKNLNIGFIYPIPLMEWVSNPVPIDKKQGTIRVCVHYHDLNVTYPKYNYPTPFIDQILDDCAGCESFSFMDGFIGYNHIAIKKDDQHKTAFICPWGTFAYRKLPFGLKNAGANFEWAMDYAFHDIRHIVQAYLDDLPAHSKKRPDHLAHLKEIFVRCRFYNIHLNPHKCIFMVESRCLLGFIVSKHEIRVGLDKVKVIVELSTPLSILQLQRLQGKA